LRSVGDPKLLGAYYDFRGGSIPAERSSFSCGANQAGRLGRCSPKVSEGKERVMILLKALILRCRVWLLGLKFVADPSREM
jgi:hypothetical protein